MTQIDIFPNLDDMPWTDLVGKVQVTGRVARIGVLPNGTTSGAPSVAIVIEMPDGTFVIGETTWNAFNVAARALAASPVHGAAAADISRPTIQLESGNLNWPDQP